MDYMELSINDFTDSLLDWGVVYFDTILLEKAHIEAYKITDNQDEAHYFVDKFIDDNYYDSGYYGFCRNNKPAYIDITKYLSTLTNGFDKLLVDPVIKDMLLRFEAYKHIIWQITIYIKNNNLPLEAPLDSVFKDIPQKVTYNNILYYWRGYLDNSLFDYAISILKTHMDKFPAPESRWSQPEQPTLPADMDTERARKFLHKAEDAGLIIKTSTGYRWTSILGRGQLAQLAYFCNRIYCPNNTETLPETSINLFFGVSRIGSALTQALSAKKPQKWRNAIDCIFED